MAYRFCLVCITALQVGELAFYHPAHQAAIAVFDLGVIDNLFHLLKCAIWRNKCAIFVAQAAPFSLLLPSCRCRGSPWFFVYEWHTTTLTLFYRIASL